MEGEMKNVSWSWAGIVIALGSSASARDPLYAPLPNAAAVFQDAEPAPPPVPILSPAREVGAEPVYDDGLCRPSQCLPWWAHNHNVHADWLFLSAREQDLDYATPVDGTTNTAVPVGQTAMLSPGYQSGWRIGGALAIDNCSSMFFDWTSFSSSTRSETLLDGGAPQPNSFLRSELVHPRTLSVAADSLNAAGVYDVDFETADAGYTRTLTGDWNARLNGSVGFRYGGLSQDLTAQQQILGDVLVNSSIDFAGYGPRAGLDYERLSSQGMLLYCRGAGSLLAGRFESLWQQSSVFAGPQAVAGINEDRIVPQFDLELGTGFQTRGGGFRATVGYLYSIWGNVVTMPEFIDSVQADALRGTSDTLAFDGLAVRAEFRF
jgi:hypothetical protein